MSNFSQANVEKMATRKMKRTNRKTLKKRQTGGDACPKGGKHNWKRQNPKNMAGWCTCTKCKKMASGVC